MMAAEEAGQFVYIPAEEGGDSDPVLMDHSESSKPSEDKIPVSLPKSPKSPASPVKTHVSILQIIPGILGHRREMRAQRY